MRHNAFRRWQAHAAAKVEGKGYVLPEMHEDEAPYSLHGDDIVLEEDSETEKSK